MISSVVILAGALFAIAYAQFDLSECLKSKSCIFYPAHCEETGTCEKIISYAPQPDGWTVMELFFNGTNPGTNYAAIGFSGDDQMGEESVTHCSFDETNQPGVFLSRNNGKQNAPLNLTDEIVAEYVELLQASLTPNSIYCKFRQKIMPDDAAQKLYIPDLNQSYHLLLAHGKTDNSRALAIHSLADGTKDFPSIITTPINVAALESTEPITANPKPKSKRIFVLVHGILMLLGWLWLVASAITAARYLREHWPHSTPMGLKIWFHMHRTMNIMAVVLVIIAVLLIFIGKEWRWTGPAVGRSSTRNLSPAALHSLLGAIACCLIFTQPVGALLRCDHDSKFRPIFNWTHRLCGLLAFVLALIAILLAVIYFHVWVVRWAAILVFAIYLLLLTLMIIMAQRANVLETEQMSSVTYETGGRHYRGEQINVITKAMHDDKGKKLVAAIVLTFIALAALLSIIMMILILTSQ